MTHTNQEYIKDYSCSEGHFLRLAIELANKVNWRKQNPTEVKRQLHPEEKRRCDKEFKNERIIHFYAY